MIKKYKKKMLFINLIITSIVIITSFTVIYTLTSNSIMNDNIERVKRNQVFTEGSVRNPYDEFIKNEHINGFNLFVDENFNLTKISSNLDISDDVYYDIIANIDDSTGEYEIVDRVWLYEVSKVPFNTELNNISYRISFVDITESFDALNNLLIVLILVGFISLTGVYFISLFFANKASKPIEEMIFKQKQFVADATHELKTPLTIINANIEAIKSNENEYVKDQFKWLNYIKEESKNMNKLVSQLLLSAKAEEEKYVYTNINLSQVINECILSFEPIIFEKNIKLKTYIYNDIYTYSDKEKIIQVIKILIDNAIKYNKEKGKIEISLYKLKKHIYIKVSNTGTFISKTEINNIFDRFYKSDKSRNDSSYGLGLYIAKSIVTKLNGLIEVKSEKNKTTDFIIKL